MASRAVDNRARRYDPAETRQRVLAAANMLFTTKGFGATGTADIAREADVSEGSIFYHFGSKQNLLAELGQRYGEAMIEAMQQDDALEELEPGVPIPRIFEFCRTNRCGKRITGSACEVGTSAAVHKNPEAEPFYQAAKARRRVAGSGADDGGLGELQRHPRHRHVAGRVLHPSCRRRRHRADLDRADDAERAAHRRARPCVMSARPADTGATPHT